MINLILLPFKIIIWIILLPFKFLAWLIKTLGILAGYLIGFAIIVGLLILGWMFASFFIFNPIFWKVILVSFIAYIPIALIFRYYDSKKSQSKNEIQTDEIENNKDIILEKQVHEDEKKFQIDEDLMICPHCDEQIKKNAIKCKYCKEFI